MPRPTWRSRRWRLAQWQIFHGEFLLMSCAVAGSRRGCNLRFESRFQAGRRFRLCVHDKSLAKVGGSWMGSSYLRLGRVRSLELGWWCVEASGNGSCRSVLLGRVSTDSPRRRSHRHRERVEDASGAWSVHSFDRSLELGVCVGSRLGR